MPKLVIYLVCRNVEKKLFYHLCDFVVRDIKIAVYLESSRKINFRLVSGFLVSEISEKTDFKHS